MRARVSRFLPVEQRDQWAAASGGAQGAALLLLFPAELYRVPQFFCHFFLRSFICAILMPTGRSAGHLITHSLSDDQHSAAWNNGQLK